MRTPNQRFVGRAAIVDRLARVLLYTATSRRRPTAIAMARGLGVTERTIRRDLKALEEAGWPMPPAVCAVCAAWGGPHDHTCRAHPDHEPGDGALEAAYARSLPGEGQ